MAKLNDIVVMARVVQEDDLIEHIAERFLKWKLPGCFNPDDGISFHPPENVARWPIGTNLLDKDQARSLAKYLLGDDE